MVKYNWKHETIWILSMKKRGEMYLKYFATEKLKVKVNKKLIVLRLTRLEP